MKNPLPLSDLLTFQEAAEFLNTSESSIRRLMQQDPSFPTLDFPDFTRHFPASDNTPLQTSLGKAHRCLNDA